MKKLLLALALFILPVSAFAQCNGVFANNTVCGNITGANNTPRPTNPSAFLGAAGGTNGQIQFNNSGALGGFTASGDALINTSTGVVTVKSFGGLAIRVVTTGSVNLTTSDFVVVVNKTIGSTTPIPLPSSPATGLSFRIKDGKGDAWTNPITITPASGLIDGQSSYTLNVGFGEVDLTFNGTQWNIL